MADVTFGLRVTGIGDGISASPVLSGTVGALIDWQPTGPFTDTQKQIGFDKDALKGIVVTVSGNTDAAVTLETNATDHAGGQIFTFPTGGGEFLWTNRSPNTNPVTADVATTYWTYSGADEIDVQLRALI